MSVSFLSTFPSTSEPSPNLDGNMACSGLSAPRVANGGPVLEFGLVAGTNEGVHLAVRQHLDKVREAVADMNVHRVDGIHRFEHDNVVVGNAVTACKLSRGGRACVAIRLEAS